MDTYKDKLGEQKNSKELSKEFSQKDNYQSILFPYIRIALMAIMMATGTNMKSEEVSSIDAPSFFLGEDPKKNETTKNISTYEFIFKDGIRKSLANLNAINEIPLSGKNIDYYRDNSHPKLAGKKMTPEAIKGNNLPDKFNISPRTIEGSVVSMNLYLGDRVFNIEPWLGKIQNIDINKNELFIETTFKNIIYDKENELPRLILKLWRTPIGKGKKEGFKGSTVTEL